MDPETLAQLFSPNASPYYAGGMSGGYTPGDPFNNPTPTIFPWLGNSGVQVPQGTPPSGLPPPPTQSLATPTQVQGNGEEPTDLSPPSPGAAGSQYPEMTPLPARGPAPAGSQEKGGGGDTASRLLATLRGVQAPAAPVAQKVGTPHPPQIRPIQGGGLVNLLASLGIGPRDVYQVPRIQLPGR